MFVRLTIILVHLANLILFKFLKEFCNRLRLKMTHIELESWIAKTLILLKSPSEESVEELRSMLVETIHQKYNGRKQFKMIPPITGCEYNEKNKTKESKSHSLNEQKQKTSSGGFSPSVTVSPDSYASDSDSSSYNNDMVILEEDSTCIVCREGVFPQWNQYMDCAECHAVYHQQCHNPPVPESELNDPRVVWYCRNCTKTLSKPKVSSLSGSSSQNSKNSSSKISTSGRSNTSSPSFGSKPFGGVSVSSKKSSSSKSSNSSSSKSHTPNINIISADKRLQIMKKKAARKQEKRPK